MALQIIWSSYAERDQDEILRYWAKRNKSKTYPRLLFHLFESTVNSLAKQEFNRHPTSAPDIFYKYVRNYRVYFEVNSTSIVILHIWDARRNPENAPY